MSNAITTADDVSAVLERVVVQGDLSKLSPQDRVIYYGAVCESIGINPLTQPFAYITLNGKLTLYALKSATDQVRKLHHVNVTIVARERIEDVYVVTARATMPDGRTDESIGAVAIAGLKGDGLANALMKAETKAKRRVTLSIVGLGMLDESETEMIPGARFHPVDPEPVRAIDRETGEIQEREPTPLEMQLYEDRERIISEADACTEYIHRGKLNQIHREAKQLGLRDVAEVDAAIEAAIERIHALTPAKPTQQTVHA